MVDVDEAVLASFWLLQGSDQTVMDLMSQYADLRSRSGNFTAIPRLAVSQIQKFWHTQEGNSPELTLLSQTVLGYMPTEAAAERSFSSQGHVHRPLRASLGHGNVESEVFLRWNLPAFLKAKKQYNML